MNPQQIAAIAAVISEDGITPLAPDGAEADGLAGPAMTLDDALTTPPGPDAPEPTSEPAPEAVSPEDAEKTKAELERLKLVRDRMQAQQDVEKEMASAKAAQGLDRADAVKKAEMATSAQAALKTNARIQGQLRDAKAQGKPPKIKDEASAAIDALDTLSSVVLGGMTKAVPNPNAGLPESRQNLKKLLLSDSKNIGKRLRE